MKVVPPKINMGRIVTDHLSTFGDIDGRHKCGDYFTFYIMPALVAAAYFFAAKEEWIKCIHRDCWGAALTVCSIFIPLSMTMLISLRSLRKELAKDTDRVKKLVRQLSFNSGYEIVVATIFLLFILLVYAVDMKCNLYCSTVYVIMFCHLILTLMLIVKRFYLLFVRE